MEKLKAIFNRVLDYNGKFDLEDLYLAWTWYDDDGEDCGTSQVISLRIHDGKCFVEFDDRVELLDNLDYMDVLGSNFVDYLYDELF